MANTSTYKGIYAMHKYWGKKPFNEISKFIERYSSVDEIVMDCFCGSGVTLIEAIKADRKAVGLDLNPIAIKLANVSMTVVEIDKINETFNLIKEKLKKKIYSLYEMNYESQHTIVTHTIWKNGKPIEVWYSTDNDRKKIRIGNDIDINMCYNPKIEPKWYPKSMMFENSRINVNKEQKVADLFTPRALVGLSLLCDEIEKIRDDKLRSVFELTLSGTLSQASNLVFVIRRRKTDKGEIPKAEVGSWVIGYWVPEEHFEINVWNCFENRFRRILKGEKEIYNLFSGKNDGYMKEHLSLINGSATNIPRDDNSVDYVFIDPPHINRILYMEQSLMWNAWLKLDSCIDWNNEIIVTEAKDRKGKDKENYNYLLDKAFAEIGRVLKKGKYFSLAFNCLDDSTWIDMLNLIIAHGFEIYEIVPLEYSATSVVQDNRKNALKTDLVLTFKNTGKLQSKKIISKDDDYKLEVDIKNIMKNNMDYEVYNIMNSLFEKTIPNGYIYKVSKIIKISSRLLG